MKKVMDLTVEMTEKVAGGASCSPCSCSCTCNSDDQKNGRNSDANGTSRAAKYLDNNF